MLMNCGRNQWARVGPLVSADNNRLLPSRPLTVRRSPKTYTKGQCHVVFAIMVSCHIVLLMLIALCRMNARGWNVAIPAKSKEAP